MIDAILEQVRISIDRVVTAHPILRNDRDDLVQDVFVKILPRLGGEGFTLDQHRAFAHKATFWVCQTALRSVCNQNAKNVVSLDCAGVQYLGDEAADDAAGMLRGGFIEDVNPVNWSKVVEVYEANEALFVWYDIEPDREIRTMLRHQLEAKFEL